MDRFQGTLACSVLAFSFVPSCHDSGGGGSSTPGAQDSAGPSVTVDFPPGTVLTGASSIHVRGRVFDASGVRHLAFDGALATIDPTTGRFEADVALVDGDNSFSVEAVDARGNQTVIPSAVRVRRATPLLGTPCALVVDAAGGRLLVLDPLFHGVITVDLATGRRGILTEDDAGAALADATALVLAEDELWVADGAELQRVDLASGTRARIASSTTTPEPTRIDALAYDSVTERVFALDGSAPARVFTYDKATGARTLLSGAGNGAGIELASPIDLVFDAPRARLLVLEAAHIVAIDTATGARTELSGAGPTLQGASACVLAPGSGLLYAADPLARGLFTVDLASGERVFVPDADPRRPAFDADAKSLAWDAAFGRLLVPKWNGIAAVDPARASATPFSIDAVGVGRPLREPGELAFDAARDQLLVHDHLPGGSRLVRVFVRTGSRRTGSSVNAAPFATSADLALDRGNDRLLALATSSTWSGPRLLAFRLADGRRTDLGGVPLTGSARGLALLSGGTSAALFSASELVRFDLDSRTAEAIVTTTALGELQDIVVDDDTLFVLDVDPSAPDIGRVLRVQSAGGGTTVLAAGADWRPTVVANEFDGARMYALDALGNALVAVDTSTGERVVIASDALPDAATRRAPSLGTPRGLAFDSVRRIAYSSHAGGLRGVVVTDVETGERVILSR